MNGDTSTHGRKVVLDKLNLSEHFEFRGKFRVQVFSCTNNAIIEQWDGVIKDVKRKQTVLWDSDSERKFIFEGPGSLVIHLSLCTTECKPEDCITDPGWITQGVVLVSRDEIESALDKAPVCMERNLCAPHPYDDFRLDHTVESMVSCTFRVARVEVEDSGTSEMCLCDKMPRWDPKRLFLSYYGKELSESGTDAEALSLLEGVREAWGGAARISYCLDWVGCVPLPFWKTSVVAAAQKFVDPKVLGLFLKIAQFGLPQVRQPSEHDLLVWVKNACVIPLSSLSYVQDAHFEPGAHQVSDEVPIDLLLNHAGDCEDFGLASLALWSSMMTSPIEELGLPRDLQEHLRRARTIYKENYMPAALCLMTHTISVDTTVHGHAVAVLIHNSSPEKTLSIDPLYPDMNPEVFRKRRQVVQDLDRLPVFRVKLNLGGSLDWKEHRFVTAFTIDGNVHHATDYTGMGLSELVRTRFAPVTGDLPLVKPEVVRHLSRLKPNPPIHLPDDLSYLEKHLSGKMTHGMSTWITFALVTSNWQKEFEHEVAMIIDVLESSKNPVRVMRSFPVYVDPEWKFGLIWIQ